ncbi:MAG: hypothetical protein AAGI49_17980, partial [Bacteroidota bacterium]
MKQTIITLILTVFFLLTFVPSPIIKSLNAATNSSITFINDSPDSLKIAVFKILDAKCNVCHRRQNPFKVFSLKNMNKHAAKIHQQVFVLRRMPKGGTIKL